MSENPYSAPKTNSEPAKPPSPFDAKRRDTFRNHSQLLGFLWLVCGGIGLWSFLSDGNLPLIPLGMSALLVGAGGLTMMGKLTGLLVGLGLSYIILAMLIYAYVVSSSIPIWVMLLFVAAVAQGHRLLLLRKKIG